MPNPCEMYNAIKYVQIKKEIYKMLFCEYNSCITGIIQGALLSFLGPQKTGVLVEFSNLAFHFIAPGDLSDEELDDVLQFLHERIQKHEKTEIQLLKYLNESLKRWDVDEIYENGLIGIMNVMQNADFGYFRR